ncbi:MAG: hypothetical protein SV775_13495 [Thermodesulfobacteriota bacterium]|nr:hypothetical protein [Thermodesulfobacteriota bacterium]
MNARSWARSKNERVSVSLGDGGNSSPSGEEKAMVTGLFDFTDLEHILSNPRLQDEGCSVPEFGSTLGRNLLELQSPSDSAKMLQYPVSTQKIREDRDDFCGHTEVFRNRARLSAFGNETCVIRG